MTWWKEICYVADMPILSICLPLTVHTSLNATVSISFSSIWRSIFLEFWYVLVLPTLQWKFLMKLNGTKLSLGTNWNKQWLIMVQAHSVQIFLFMASKEISDKSWFLTANCCCCFHYSVLKLKIHFRNFSVYLFKSSALETCVSR